MKKPLKTIKSNDKPSKNNLGFLGVPHGGPGPMGPKGGPMGPKRKAQRWEPKER